ncbi:MAG: Crp/Fnr family transcriptional regulator [Flavobacterium sp.]
MDNFKDFSAKLFPLEDFEIELFEALFVPISVKKKECLFEEATTIQDIFFLSEGVFRCFAIKDGKEITADIIAEPILLTDLLAIRRNTKAYIHLQALEDATCFKANFKSLEQLMFQNINIKRFVFKLYEQIYMNGVKRQVSFIYDSQAERYQDFLAQYEAVIDKIPNQVIASYLGLRPETLSRIRQKVK